MGYLDSNGDGKVSIVEFVDEKMVTLMRILFDGFDKNKNGRVELSEATLESLLNVQFIRVLVKETFDFFDANNDNLISVEDIPPSIRNLTWTKLEEVCEASSEVVDCKRFFFDVFPHFDTDHDGVINFEELQFKVQRLFQLFMSTSEEPDCTPNLKWLAHIDEPREVEETLRHYLSPFLKTLPRAILQSLVRSSDKNSDGAMDFEELTTFGDFNLVYNIWPQHLQMARGSGWGMRKCDGNSCFPSSISSRRAVYSYFTSSEVLWRIIRNILYSR